MWLKTYKLKSTVPGRFIMHTLRVFVERGFGLKIVILLIVSFSLSSTSTAFHSWTSNDFMRIVAPGLSCVKFDQFLLWLLEKRHSNYKV